MREFRDHLKELDRLLRLAFSEANRLGSVVVGPEELVLAILHPEAGNSIALERSATAGSSGSPWPS